MDKYDLLVKLHQIQTAVINKGLVELRDFINEIFESLSEEELGEYYVRLGMAILQARKIENEKGEKHEIHKDYP